MTDYEFLQTETRDGVYILTLNRPDKLNAVNVQMDIDWLHALQEAAADPQVKVVLQRGNGRAFSAGHDLREVGEIISQLGDAASDWSHVYERIWPQGSPLDLLAGYEKPIVSALHGHVVGQVVFQVLASDLIVAARDTVFNLEVVRTGGAGGVARLSGLMPPKLMNELAYLGTMSAPDLLSSGVVNRVVDDAEAAFELAFDMARRMARIHPSSLFAYKRAVNEIFALRGIGDFAAAFEAIKQSHGNDDDNAFWAMASEQGVGEALRWREREFGGD